MIFDFKTYINLTKECEHLEKLIKLKKNAIWRLENGMEIEKWQWRGGWGWKKIIIPEEEKPTKSELEKGLEKLYMEFHENYLQSLKEKQAIEDMIDSLNDPMERTLMRLRYLECIKWERVYTEIELSKSHTFKNHKIILERIRNSQPEEKGFEMKFDSKTYANLTKECKHLEKNILDGERALKECKKRFESEEHWLSETAISKISKAIEELEKELESLHMKFHDRYLQSLKEKQAIEDMIDSLGDPMERTLMRLRYIEGLKWDDIYGEIHYEWTQTGKIHRRTLEKIWKTKTTDIEFRGAYRLQGTYCYAV